MIRGGEEGRAGRDVGARREAQIAKSGLDVGGAIDDLRGLVNGGAVDGIVARHKQIRAGEDGLRRGKNLRQRGQRRARRQSQRDVLEAVRLGRRFQSHRPIDRGSSLGRQRLEVARGQARRLHLIAGRLVGRARRRDDVAEPRHVLIQHRTEIIKERDGTNFHTNLLIFRLLEID